MQTRRIHFAFTYYACLTQCKISWEPQENLKQCERLLTSFWKHIGTDDDDYSVGYEAVAQDSWISQTR